jgi:hypothetical protein
MSAIQPRQGVEWRTDASTARHVDVDLGAERLGGAPVDTRVAIEASEFLSKGRRRSQDRWSQRRGRRESHGAGDLGELDGGVFEDVPEAVGVAAALREEDLAVAG